MAKRMSMLLKTVCLFGLASILLSGCGSNSNDPIVSNLVSGNGYNIRMTASQETITPGGSVQVTAMVTDSTGTPVKDEEEVTFSASEEGTFEGVSDGKAKTKNGAATAVFRAPTQAMNSDKPMPSRSNRIFAGYQGALSYVEVSLVSTTW